MVFERLFKSGVFRGNSRASTDRAAEAVYETIVAQAREPVLYVEFGVTDDFDGRFELLVLHVHLVLRRLQGEGAQAAELGQTLFDTLFHDMDRSLRAIGVGDMSVGKKVKQMVAAFYGRAHAYDAALASDDPAALSGVLARNVLAREEATSGAPLADYVRVQITTLADQPAERICDGSIRFAKPAREGAV